MQTFHSSYKAHTSTYSYIYVEYLSVNITQVLTQHYCVNMTNKIKQKYSYIIIKDGIKRKMAVDVVVMHRLLFTAM